MLLISLANVFLNSHNIGFDVQYFVFEFIEDF
jgi:uncharacterized protein (UPF0276 family)